MTERRTVRLPPAAFEHLRSADPVMAAIVDRIGPLEYSIDPDPWRSIIGSIVGQQLSVAAAATIRSRVAALGEDGYPTPERLVSLPEERLRACGLSRAKTAYVRDAARAWLEGDVDPARLRSMPDEEVVAALVGIKGVGRWTAEMMLVFCLDRPDVLALDDLGLRTAVQRAYGLGERPARAELEAIGAAWAPFRSHASRYLWRSLDGAA